jgi:hypothetical protein
MVFLILKTHPHRTFLFLQIQVHGNRLALPPKYQDVQYSTLGKKIMGIHHNFGITKPSGLNDLSMSQYCTVQRDRRTQGARETLSAACA